MTQGMELAINAKRLRELTEEVRRWREHGKTGQPRVPEKVWDSAVDLARSEGIWAVAKALRLNYYGLKKRVEETEIKRADVDGSKSEAAPAFVEVQMGAVDPGSRKGNVVVELWGREGSRMRIETEGSRDLDLLGLAQAFWRRES